LTEKKVLVVMGSASDADYAEEAVSVLKKFEIAYDVRALSAHRSPDVVLETARGLVDQGFGVVIALAGCAAHLAGVVAGATTLPVIGVPLPASDLRGMDALLSTAQMPRGVPVATMSLGKAGAFNAGVLAAEILALNDSQLHERLKAYKKELKQKVLESDAQVRGRLKDS